MPSELSIGDFGVLHMPDTPDKNPTLPTKDMKGEELYNACLGFEEYFLRYMLKEMRGEMNMFGSDNHASKMYQEMFDENMAAVMAKRGQLGIADMMFKQLSKELGVTGTITSEYMAGSPVEQKLDSFDALTRQSAESHGLEPELLRAVMRQESGGNPWAVSNRGAKGLMQLMDGTAREMGVQNPYDPAQNIEGGAEYLDRMLSLFDGDTELALAAYNAGPMAVQQYGGIPPYPETQNYVANVMSMYETYKKAGLQPVEQVAQSTSGNAFEANQTEGDQ